MNLVNWEIPPCFLEFAIWLNLDISVYFKCVKHLKQYTDFKFLFRIVILVFFHFFVFCFCCLYFFTSFRYSRRMFLNMEKHLGSSVSWPRIQVKLFYILSMPFTGSFMCGSSYARL